MERIRKAIDGAEQLERKYDLPVEDMKRIAESYEDFRVYIPLLGRFSAGKSALINMVLGLGLDVCRENIGVATALPAEICAGEEEAVYIYRPEKERVTFQEYLGLREELSAENAEKVKLVLNNETLQRFPSVALVDMPGLDSGYEIHDKAIDNYIHKSLAYVLVFPADELIIPKSMEPFLFDLDTYDIPMCVVITKGNRIAGAEEQRKSELRNSLKKYFPNREYEIFITEKENGAVDEFAAYLERMDSEANSLGIRHYRKKLEPEFAKVSNYLLGYIKSMDLSMSELEEQRDRLQADMEQMNATVKKELEEFTAQIPIIVDAIGGDVQAALSERTEEIVSDLMHDTDVASYINEIVREAITAGYQTRVMPSLEKHMSRISDAMIVGSAGYAGALRINVDEVCGKGISGIGKTAITVLGYIFGGPLGGLIAFFITKLFNGSKNEKREEAKRKIRQKLSLEVFPTIGKEVKEKVQMDLQRISLEVSQNVEKNVGAQMEVLQKSLNAVMARKETEDKEKAQRRGEIEQDIRVLEELKDGIN